MITQVSRFGVWKNPWQVLDIYHQVKQHMPSVQLAMDGALEAKDDIKAVEILADLQQNYVRGDPDIHLLSDPAIIDHEVVNALQRFLFPTMVLDYLKALERVENAHAVVEGVRGTTTIGNELVAQA